MGYFTRIKTDRYLQIWPDCRRYFPALSLLLLSSVTLAQPGSLDTDFNGSGALYDTYNPNDHASRRNQAILPIINPDGSFQMLGITSDSSSSLALTNFSANGQREEVILIPGPTGTAAALTADNKLIVGRQSASVAGINSPGYLKRFTRDGALDASFASGGTFADSNLLFLGSEFSIAIDAENRILVTSFSNGLIRFTPDGVPDTTFGTNGVGELPADKGQFETFLAQIQATDGAYYLLTGGSGGDANSLLRLTSSGTLDTGFGDGGRKKLLANSGTHNILAMPDGGVLALEGCLQGNPVCRLSHFGSTGATVATATVREVPAGAATQARLLRGALLARLDDGRIVLSAHWTGTLSAPPWLSDGQLFGMFNGDLTPVTEFDGDNGLIVHPLEFEFNTTMPGRGVLGQTADGGILLIGEGLAASDNYMPRWAAVRLNGGVAGPGTPPEKPALPVRLTQRVDGRSSTAVISGGIYNSANALATQATAPAQVEIEVSIAPEPEDVGQSVQILVVVEVGGAMLTVNSAGAILPFDETNLQFFTSREAVAALETFTLFDGVLATGDRGSYNIFVGYLRTGDMNQGNIIYNAVPISLVLD